MRSSLPFVITLIAVVTSGCAGQRGRGAAAHPSIEQAVFRVDEEGHHASSDAALDAALAGAQVVYLGERHDDARIHRYERDLLARMVMQDSSVGLGLEMLPTSMQGPLDDFVAGRIDEPTFLAAVDWKHTWGFPFEQYRPLLLLCREHHLRAFALNADPRLPRKLARGGMAALTEEERQNLPEMRPGPAEHRAQLEEAFRAHHGAKFGSDGLERFYLAQLLWDETMAQSVARALAAPEAPRRLLVVVGAGHALRFAIPERARRRGVERDVIVVPVAATDLADAPKGGTDFVVALRR